MSLDIPKGWITCIAIKNLLLEIGHIKKIKNIATEDEDYHSGFINFFRENSKKVLGPKKLFQIESVIKKYGQPRKFNKDKENKWTIPVKTEWPIYLTDIYNGKERIYEVLRPTKNGVFIELIKVSPLFLRKQFGIKD